MLYRRLVRSDIAAISRVHRSACLVAYTFLSWRYSEQEVQDWYAVKFTEWDWGLVAERDRVIGFVATAGAHLDQLFIEPAHQGAGIGTHLLTTALARMPARVTLNVFEDNGRARRFYERHGFGEVGQVHNQTENATELIYARGSSSTR